MKQERRRLRIVNTLSAGVGALTSTLGFGGHSTQPAASNSTNAQPRQRKSFVGANASVGTQEQKEKLLVTPEITEVK
jgi:hypothetical protein